MPLLLIAAGLVLLVLGAEFLVRGAARLAAAVGISPLVVGLTVVAFGTSAPELAVSMQSALGGRADLAVGNAVGSNIFNVLFILGVSALITPLAVSHQLIRLDVPLMIGTSLLLLVLAIDGAVGRVEGALLFGGIVAYTVFLVRQSRRDTAAGPGPPGPEDAARPSAGRNVLLAAAGLALLLVGSHWLLTGAVHIAAALGVSERVIGLTLVAAGTSLPELATSVVASIRGERDIAVGNVVGSNIFNILAVLGLSALLAPAGLSVSSAVASFDIPVMTAVAFACLPVFLSGRVIARWEGALFLGYYAAYATYLVVDAVNHPALPGFRTALLFVVPLTLVTLAVAAVRRPRR